MPIPERQERYLNAWGRIGSTVAPNLDHGVAEVIEQFGHACDAWSRDYRGPLCLAHHDYRIDNMLFASGPPATRIWVVDWQTMGWGPPSWDLAYLMGTSLTPQDRRTCERTLVLRHVDALRDRGISDWTSEQAWQDYRKMAFGALLLTVPAAGEVRTNSRARTMFVTMWNRVGAMIRDLDSMEFLASDGGTGR